MSRPEEASASLTAGDASVIKLLLRLGFMQKRIAALFDCNQGRIAEISRGQRFDDVKAYGDD